jgi:hypothetical protein
MPLIGRLTQLLALPVALVASAGATIPAHRPALTGAAATITITIVFQCEGTRSVSPWVARIRQGDQVEWVLDPASDVSEISISKQRSMGRWPFQSELPAVGRVGAPAPGNNMRMDAVGAYGYNIEAMCPGQGRSMRKAVITPEIIVE